MKHYDEIYYVRRARKRNPFIAGFVWIVIAGTTWIASSVFLTMIWGGWGKCYNALLNAL